MYIHAHNFNDRYLLTLHNAVTILDTKLIKCLDNDVYWKR